MRELQSSGMQQAWTINSESVRAVTVFFLNQFNGMYKKNTEQRNGRDGFCS